MVYKCYFNGSHTPDISGCAFCVLVGDDIIHSNTYSLMFVQRTWNRRLHRFFINFFPQKKLEISLLAS